MVLPAKPLHIPSGLPIDEATRPEMLDVGVSNVSNVNVRFNNRRVLEKRRGFTSLSAGRLDGTTRSAGYRMFMNGEQVCTIDGTNLDVYSGAAGLSVLKSQVSEASNRMLEAPSVGTAPTYATNAVGPVGGDTVTSPDGKYVAIAYRTADNSSSISSTYYASVTLLEVATQVVLISPQNLHSTTGLTIRLASYTGFILAVVFDDASHNIRLYKLDLASTTTIALGWVLVTGTLATDYLSGGVAVNSTQITGCTIAYQNNSGGASQVSVRTLNASGLLSSTTITSTGTSLRGLSISENGSALWVAWTSGTSVKACALNEASSLVVVATTATIIASGNVSGAQDSDEVFVSPRGSGDASVFVSTQNLFTKAVAVRNNAGAVATAGVLTTYANALITSRPFVLNGKTYAHFTNQVRDALVLVECTPDTTGVTNQRTYLRPVSGPLVRGLFYACSHRISQTGSLYYSAITVKRSGTTFGTSLVEYDFANAYRWQPATVNGSTFLSGGITSVFDGTRLVESGFLMAPVVALAGATSGGLLTFTLGGRAYVATYEEVDADGNWHISGVSSPSTRTGNQTLVYETISLTGLAITSRGIVLSSSVTTSTVTSSLKIGIWGTLDGGSTYYRVGEVINDPNSAAIAFADNVPDATLAANALLYGTGSLPGTSGSSQDHRAPPGLSHIVAYNGMIVGSNGNTLWYGSQPIDGQGTWFSPVFTQSGTVDDEITGIAVQDGSVVVFCRRSVFVTNGDPPADNGSSGGLATLRRLAIDQGCTNANSILTTSAGTFYQSDRGIELLTRGQTSSFAGEAVQDELATYPVVTSAVLDTVNSLARFTLATSQPSGLASATGKDIIFDLTQNAWVSVDDKMGSTATQSSQDAAMILVGSSWRYAWLATNGVVYYERAAGDASECLDMAQWITAQYETPPLKLGLQQEMRIYEMEALFERASACGLTIEMAYDFGAYVGANDKTWTETALSGLHQVSLRPDPLRNAIQLRIRDTAPAVYGTGKGLVFIGLSADLAPKQGPTRGTPRLAVATRR